MRYTVVLAASTQYDFGRFFSFIITLATFVSTGKFSSNSFLLEIDRKFAQEVLLPSVQAKAPNLTRRLVIERDFLRPTILTEGRKRGRILPNKDGRLDRAESLG